jgi:histidinol-phosphate phosphatase family protein
LSGPVIFDVVIPTSGRPTLGPLLDALHGPGTVTGRIVVVDDRAGGGGPLPGLPGGGRVHVEVLRGRARGPAAARNDGWRACDAPWIVFLDDDVVPAPGWGRAVQQDIGVIDPSVGGVQGRIEVPRPTRRRPTDSERNTIGLERARWATADIAYRTCVLEEVGGFDERFRRAYREDADLGLRVVGAGFSITQGTRRVLHPVRPSGRWASVRAQAGNADDVLMRALHGAGWRAAAGAPRGRRTRHVAVAASGLAAIAALRAGRRRAACLTGAAWVAGTAELAWARIAPGPRGPSEVWTMVATSIALPFAAAGWSLWGLLRVPWSLSLTAAPAPRRQRAPGPPRRPALGSTDEAAPPEAVLFDRDGTLVEDVPYNGDPALVRPMPGAREALEQLRIRGIRTAVVSNQSGVARGLISRADVAAVNRRMEELLGPLGPFVVCPHGPDEGCECRKPAPGMVRRAAAELGIDPSRCAVVGDIGADVEAAEAAGARAVLVPTPRTLSDEIDSASEVAPDLLTAVELLIGIER